MDNAIGDYLLLSTPTMDELGALGAMIDALGADFDVIIAESRTQSRDPGRVYRLLETIFFSLYSSLTGIVFDQNPSPLRLFSRPAALHIIGQPNGEMLLRSRTFEGGFPVPMDPAGSARFALRTRVGADVAGEPWAILCGLMLTAQNSF